MERLTCCLAAGADRWPLVGAASEGSDVREMRLTSRLSATVAIVRAVAELLLPKTGQTLCDFHDPLPLPKWVDQPKWSTRILRLFRLGSGPILLPKRGKIVRFGAHCPRPSKARITCKTALLSDFWATLKPDGKEGVAGSSPALGLEALQSGGLGARLWVHCGVLLNGQRCSL